MTGARSDRPVLLITGGSGYLGAELVRQALATWRVVATCHTRHGMIDGLVLQPLDLRDEDAVARLVEAVAPDLVIHTAYVQSGPDLWPVTVEGTGYVARAARRAGARLIHMSSDAIFDGERAGAYIEADAGRPITAYGEAKAAAEQVVAEICSEALIVRTSLIYGGAQLSKHEQLILEAADGHADIAFFTDEIRCPVQVSDLAQALLEVAHRSISGVLHLAGADAVSRYEFACLVAAAHGRSPGRLRSGMIAESTLRRPRNCALAIDKARTLLHTPLRGVREVFGSG